ncbi:MAG: hypothetical protein B5766_12785 [Candidatus Lumbricidophila eiseniae]|uniref:HTH tetR-type domain-containing protein n=1 Tax=Candidatus Lumbricidiphila eiseniae TaxID=1969409 RepID=A0A2A6FMJ5_9MICO|nr:MAG: hypothetical protein B5766_12785 [Candidatus Lumbricidophila eiseniae]
MAEQARALATREKIVESAAQLFSTTNYHVATMAGLAHAAGVTQGALYFHFDSKVALAQEIVGAAAPYSDWVATTEQLVARARVDGDLSQTLSISDAARIVVGSFTGTQMLSGVRESWGDLRSRLEELWRFLLPILVVRERVHFFVDTPRLVWSVEAELAQIGAP